MPQKNSEEKVSVAAFENAVFEIERVRILVRLPRGSRVGKYKYIVGRKDDTSVTTLIRDRIMRYLPKGTEVDVIGNDQIVHGRMNLGTLRQLMGEKKFEIIIKGNVISLNNLHNLTIEEVE